MLTRAVGLLTAVVIGAACAHSAAEGRPAGRGSTDPLAALVSDLRAQGGTVVIGDPVSEPFFSAPGRLLLVNGQEVQALRFQTPAAATAAARAVSPDGYSVGPSEEGVTTVTQIDWIGTPHFYQRGRLILLYVGDAVATQQVLRDVLGSSFAGGN
jgi:hypothetical protein